MADAQSTVYSDDEEEVDDDETEDEEEVGPRAVATAAAAAAGGSSGASGSGSGAGARDEEEEDVSDDPVFTEYLAHMMGLITEEFQEAMLTWNDEEWLMRDLKAVYRLRKRRAKKALCSLHTLNDLPELTADDLRELQEADFEDSGFVSKWYQTAAKLGGEWFKAICGLEQQEQAAQAVRESVRYA